MASELNIAISTVPGDALAPAGARPSAGMVMTKFGSVYVEDHLLKKLK